MDDLEQARAAAATGHWQVAYEGFAALDADRLTAADHDRYADAAWWTSRIEASILARQRAHAGHVAAGDARAAGVAAWMLFYEHQMVGRTAVAAGWLARARRHLDDTGDCVERCYLPVDGRRRGARRGRSRLGAGDQPARWWRWPGVAAARISRPRASTPRAPC